MVEHSWPRRIATIDLGTNTALLLVADIEADGTVRPLCDEEEVTRLGRGVDRSGQLAADRIVFVAETVARYVALAKANGARQLVACATSAARDAGNRGAFVAAIRERAGVTVEILSGEEEAELCFRAVHHLHGRAMGSAPLLAIDIGGGSTEIVLGREGRILERSSHQVGSVRLTERFARSQPISRDDWDAARAHLRKTFAGLRPAPAGSLLVGVAATVTTLAALHLGRAMRDTEGTTLRREDIARIAQEVGAMPPEARETLPGLNPRRADVLPMGGLILDEAMGALGVSTCAVTDRGLRYGLLLRAAGE